MTQFIIYQNKSSHSKKEYSLLLDIQKNTQTFIKGI
jgi:hypothetical protein